MLQASKDGIDIQFELQYPGIGNGDGEFPERPKFVIMRGYNGPIKFQDLYTVKITLPYLCSGAVQTHTSTAYIRQMGRREKFSNDHELQIDHERPVHVHVEIRFGNDCECLVNTAADACWFKEMNYSDISVLCNDGTTFPVSDKTDMFVRAADFLFNFLYCRRIGCSW